MSEPLLLLMLGIGLLVTAGFAKKLIKSSDYSLGMQKKPARDLQTVSRFNHSKEAFDNRG